MMATEHREPNEDEVETEHIEANEDEIENIENMKMVKIKAPRVTCRSCGFITMSSRTLNKHVSACHNGNRWPCRLCENTTSIKH